MGIDVLDAMYLHDRTIAFKEKVKFYIFPILTVCMIQLFCY